MTAEEAEAVGRFLAAHDWRRLSVVDLLSWLSTAALVQLSGGPDVLAGEAGDWAVQVAAKLESVRTADGGYAKNAEGAAGSTYHSFLVLLAHELVGQPLPRPNSLVQFLYDRQRDDGGFVEIAPMRRSGTNPTAAAVASLGVLGRVDEEVRADVAAFLKDVRGDEGGFRANSRIPFADGLSTFTGLLTLGEIGRDDLLDRERVRTFFQEWLEFPTGGFRGASWDEQADVEYTFYGLGTLALLG
jgi:geranylgeranyl transferase type-2 subunit beta